MERTQYGVTIGLDDPPGAMSIDLFPTDDWGRKKVQELKDFFELPRARGSKEVRAWIFSNPNGSFSISIAHL